jgi:hypothetical protein
MAGLTAKRNSLIHAYGLFWRRDEITWTPGHGKKFRLLGRCGTNKGSLRVLDARAQEGIYILYGNYGPYYVGLTKSLGQRLKDHTKDDHNFYWDRFCWFGFRPVWQKSVDGIQELGKTAQAKNVSPKTIIRDVEALLIRSMAVHNFSQTKFATADEWTQIKLDEVDKFMGRL